jgi:PKD repeat protein
MLFDFDRCSGHLSNQKKHTLYNVDHFGIGASFSPDSKRLYAFDDRVAFQYDLTAPDIFVSETIIAEWNGSLYYNIWPNNFYQGQLAPDGRIYVNNSNSNVNLHRVRFPNRKGVACQFMQNDIATPFANADDMPNLPNYRLGPVDGSACDTLGLDNHPLARFRWDFEDTLTPLRVTFTDLSAYEPDHWQWLFGDGVVYDTTASGEVFHSFPAPGLYTVCLVVSNINSADTLCYAIQVGEMVGSKAPAEPAHHIAAFPNPVYQLLSLQVQGIAEWQRVDAVIYDQLGRVAGHTAWRGGTGQINMAELPGGVYSLGITVDGRATGIVRVVKI